jgi:hypothetical protein
MRTAQLVSLSVIAVAEIVLLGRFLSLGFYRRGHYPFFALFVLADLAQTLAGGIFPASFNPQSLWRFWVWSETMLAVLEILVAREVWKRIENSYPGIGKVGKETIEWSFILALTVSVGSLFFDVFRATWQQHWVAWSGALVLRRAITSTIALTVAILALLIRWDPEPIAPNVRRHTRIFAAYLATTALSSLFTASRVMTSEMASALQLGLAALCFVGWVWAFRRGEDAPPPSDGLSTEEDLEAAIDDLKSLVGGLRRVRPRIFGSKKKFCGQAVQFFKS